MELGILGIIVKNSFTNIIRYGLKFYNENYEGKMQGNDKLSDEDVWSILEYIKSVWPESIQKKYKTMTKH